MYALQRFSVLKEVIDDSIMFIIMVTVFVIYFMNNLRFLVVNVCACYSMIRYSLKSFAKCIAIMLSQSLIFQVGTTVIGSALLFKNFDALTEDLEMSANHTTAQPDLNSTRNQPELHSTRTNNTTAQPEPFLGGITTERQICACTLFLSGGPPLLANCSILFHCLLQGSTPCSCCQRFPISESGP
jgi:hypothetical protein